MARVLTKRDTDADYYARNREALKTHSKERYHTLTPEQRADRKAKQNALRLADPARLEKRRREQDGVKKEVIEGYGGRCTCCGNDYLAHLTLDHVNGGGTAHRKAENARTLYRRLRRMLREGLPLDPQFQVLCWNCNWAKHTLGACGCGGVI